MSILKDQPAGNVFGPTHFIETQDTFMLIVCLITIIIVMHWYKCTVVISSFFVLQADPTD
jgi:hypothetical protein